MYWLLPNYQQDLLNAMVTSFPISASSLLRLRLSSNFSISLNIFLLLLSCCKSLDFTSFSYIQHITNFPLTSIAAPKNCGLGCCSTPSTPLMRHWPRPRGRIKVRLEPQIHDDGLYPLGLAMINMQPNQHANHTLKPFQRYLIGTKNGSRDVTPTPILGTVCHL